MQRPPRTGASPGPFRPLRHRVFREVWLSSLLSNLGLLVLLVGGAWSMTSLSASTHLVTLVHAVVLLPYVLLSMPAGAIADAYDRRWVAIASICGAIVFSVILSGVAFAGGLTPAILLGLCFLVGAANALFGPAWQASVSEQVPSTKLPAAVALNAVSFNIARSFGPAVGGVVVAFAGAGVAFVFSAVLYVPILLAFVRWKRAPEATQRAPDRIGEATISGIRFVVHSVSMRKALVRLFLCAIGAGAVVPLMPLIARDQLGGGAIVFGVLLACFGIGGVVGAVLLQRVRSALGLEPHVAAAALLFALCAVLVSLASNLAIAAFLIAIAGGAWMQVLTSFNVAIQTSAPRWVYGRAVAAFQAMSTGGLAFGAWLWGGVAQAFSLEQALIGSGVWLSGCVVLGLFMRLDARAPDTSPARHEFDEPQMELDVADRSGPIIIEVSYRLEHASADEFCEAMIEVRRVRSRIGASNWSLARDIGDATRWVERFSCATWRDYLFQRDRLTGADLSALLRVRQCCVEEPQVTRLRALSPVRSHRDVLDRARSAVDPLISAP